LGRQAIGAIAAALDDVVDDDRLPAPRPGAIDKFDRVAPGSIGTYSGPQANAFNGAQAVAAEADRVVATYGNSLTFGPTRNRGWHSIAKSLGFRLLETFELPSRGGTELSLRRASPRPAHHAKA
jgi:hypothetical protein